jgi:zinc D-Ala-D-Ala carboxypeptidase
MSTWRWFNLEEDPLIIGLDNELLAMLDMARDKAGVPFLITSGKRTVEDNKGLTGAVGDSAHLTGLAVDLSVENDNRLCLMIVGLVIAGFRRIGIYHDKDMTPRHLHIDIDKTKPQNVIFLKLEQN